MSCIVLITLVTLVVLLSLMTIEIFRERADSHYLTVEARDERGRGNRNTVELVIRLVTVTITLIKITITLTIVIATIIKCTKTHQQGERRERQRATILARSVRVVPPRELERL